MEAKDTAADNDTGGEYHLGSYGVPQLGVDNEGRKHFYDEANNRMIIERPDGEILARPLCGASPVKWVGYIAQEECGWDVKGGEQMLMALRNAAFVTGGFDIDDREEAALAGAFNPGEAE